MFNWTFIRVLINELFIARFFLIQIYLLRISFVGLKIVLNLFSSSISRKRLSMSWNKVSVRPRRRTWNWTRPLRSSKSPKRRRRKSWLRKFDRKMLRYVLKRLFCSKKFFLTLKSTIWWILYCDIVSSIRGVFDSQFSFTSQKNNIPYFDICTSLNCHI